MEDSRFKLWYTGTTTVKNIVGIVIDKILRMKRWTSNDKET
jgi:hypothetical protein